MPIHSISINCDEMAATNLLVSLDRGVQSDGRRRDGCDIGVVSFVLPLQRKKEILQKRAGGNSDRVVTMLMVDTDKALAFQDSSPARLVPRRPGVSNWLGSSNVLHFCL
jgi:hypothetical protein